MSISGLFTRIYRDIVNDKLSLIQLPDVVLRLRKALSEKNINIDILARVIQTDVGACIYLLNVANSPAYRTRVKAVDIQSAIRMLGITNFSNLITVYGARSLVHSKNPTTLKFLKAHWKKSAYRAAIASALAKSTEQVSSDKALLAGLLQDVGALPILMKLQTDELHSISLDEMDEALKTYSRKVGIVLARAWDLDADLSAVITNAGNLAYDGGAKIDLVDVVNIAQLLSQIGEPNIKWPRMEDAPCLMKFGESGLTMDISLSLLQQARDDINEVRLVLSA